MTSLSREPSFYDQKKNPVLVKFDFELTETLLGAGAGGRVREGAKEEGRMRGGTKTDEFDFAISVCSRARSG